VYLHRSMATMNRRDTCMNNSVFDERLLRPIAGAMMEDSSEVHQIIK